MAKVTEVQVPLTIKLTDRAFRKIVEQVEGDGEDAQKIAAFTQEALQAIADGALLLPAGTVARLVDIDESLSDGDALVEAAERGFGIADGQMVAKWKIDPALHESIRQRAEIQSVTVENLVQEMMDQAVSLGWFYDLEARVATLFFSREQNTQIRAVCGPKESEVDAVMRLVEAATPRLAGEENPSSDSAGIEEDLKQLMTE